jgi:hypothetical protein
MGLESRASMIVPYLRCAPSRQSRGATLFPNTDSAPEADDDRGNRFEVANGARPNLRFHRAVGAR